MRSNSPSWRALAAFVLLLGTTLFGPGATAPAGAVTSTSITSIAAGPTNTCAVTIAGAARCWGSNYYGQVGNSTNDDQPTPVNVTGLTTTTASISVGNAHACAVTTGGAAKCWGQNTTGQLGDGTTTDRNSPVTVSGLSSGVAAIAAGFDYSCAALTSGAVKCWGANNFGQLGNGTTDASLTPVTVTGLSGASKIAVSSAQLAHSCALSTSGAMSCWGNNGDGELGDGTDSVRTTPITPTGMGSAVKSMDVGNSHTCSVTSAGAALCWGFGGQGQLGNDRTFDRYLPEPVTGLSSGVASISAGVDHSCAVLTSGGVKCWGYNVDGELGDGTRNSTIVPVTTSGATGIVSVSAGGYHTCAMTGTGAATCWGGNGLGQLGDGSGNDSLVPKVVPSLAGGTTSAAMLRVATSPAVPSQITVDGAIADTWGLQWVKVLPGAHQVCFTAVAGYTTPSCQSVTATAGATTTVTGTFVARGYLQVSTSPAVGARISVDGVGRDNWGLFTDLATGSHQVCFGAVAGFTPPACQTVTVNAGATTQVTGTFTATPAATGLADVGYLRATTTPALPSQITIDGTIADTWGLNWLEIAPGSHSVCFSHVQGYTEPGCQTVTVTAGATTVVGGTFTQRGFLKVSTSPALAATITIDNVAADDWGVFTDLPAGTYHVCFGAVTGKTAPACQDPVVTAGGTTNITGTYT